MYYWMNFFQVSLRRIYYLRHDYFGKHNTVDRHFPFDISKCKSSSNTITRLFTGDIFNRQIDNIKVKQCKMKVFSTQ